MAKILSQSLDIISLHVPKLFPADKACLLLSSYICIAVHIIRALKLDGYSAPMFTDSLKERQKAFNIIVIQQLGKCSVSFLSYIFKILFTAVTHVEELVHGEFTALYFIKNHNLIPLTHFTKIIAYPDKSYKLFTASTCCTIYTIQDNFSYC